MNQKDLQEQINRTVYRQFDEKHLIYAELLGPFDPIWTLNAKKELYDLCKRNVEFMDEVFSSLVEEDHEDSYLVEKKGTELALKLAEKSTAYQWIAHEHDRPLMTDTRGLERG